jgi:hypothetical protein
MASYSFFGMQVAFKNFHRDQLRQKLHALIDEGSGTRQSFADKQRFWKRFTGLLSEAMPVFEYGDWDLVRRHGEELFNDWSTEIEAGLATEAEEIALRRDEASRPSTGAAYSLVTMMVLVDKGSNADETLGAWCDLPEPVWLTRQTFGHLIEAFSRLNYANVQADAVYIVPGADRDGIAAEDLVSDDYGLQPLT